MITIVRSPGSERSALKWLILTGLLWTQFAYASHQLTHGTEELGEPCQICTSYDHSEKALSDTACPAKEPPIAFGLPTCLTILAIADHSRVYSARAPPPSPDSSF